MPESDLTNLLIVAAVALGVPLTLGLVPRLRVPAVVVEILAGIVLGPPVLGWIEVDETVKVLALVGLAFLLFLAGHEIDPGALRGTLVRTAAIAFGISLAIAGTVGAGLAAAGLVDEPLLVAIILSATSLGVVVPVLKDAGVLGAPAGQLVVAAASIADFGAIVLLSVFFSRDGAGVGAQLATLAVFAAAVSVVALAVAKAEHLAGLSALLLRLQDGTAQIRVRATFALVVGFAVLAGTLGLEVILGAFAAGVLVTVLDRRPDSSHPLLHAKLDAVGYGVFIPVFFVASGARFDLAALTQDPATVALVPLFVAALVVVRGVPALAYRGLLHDRRQVLAAGALQATSLPFIVAATAIGVELGALSTATAAAMVAAGLVSVLMFPLVGAVLLVAPARDRAAAPPSVGRATPLP